MMPMPNKSFSMLDIMALPDEQSQIALYLVEHGAQTTQQFIAALSIEADRFEKALEALIAEGYVSQTDDGIYQIEMGQGIFRPSPKKKGKDDVDDFSSLIGDALDSLMNFDD
jgi:predicted ArsR family transcriptional regulator